MSAVRGWLRREGVPRAPIVFAVMFGLLLVSPAFGPGTVSQSSFQDVMAAFAATAPIAVAVGLGMIAGEFDLSAVATYGLAGMIAVKVGGDSPLLGLAAAAAVGVAAAGIQGFIVARFAVNAVPVTLGGYLILWGIANLLGKGQDVVVYNNGSVTEKLLQPTMSIFTVHSLTVLAAVVVLGLMLRFTRFGTSMRAIGGDRAAAAVAGIDTRRTLVLTFMIGGFVAGVGGALQSYALATASATVSFTPLITAVTAVIVGGVVISGGRGSVFGIALGVLSLALLTEALVVMNVDPQLVNVVTGTFLLIVAVLGAPELSRSRDMVRVRVRGRRAPAAAPVKA
jgi:ribose/xylose/arabinose/galactoside ABC-type transport system permease subunit